MRAALGSGWLGLRLVLWADRVESSRLSCPAHLPPAVLLYLGRKSLVLAFFCCSKSPSIQKVRCLHWKFSSVTQSCPTLCDPMDCCTPGLPVHHHLPEFTQTHVHQVGDAIQPSHPLSSPSPPTFSLSQHQRLFK